MKAAVYHTYGPPEVVRIETIKKPVPGPNDILIKVMAASVNRTDSGFRSAVYVISRFWSGLFAPKYKVLGCEYAGVVESVGKLVTDIKPGEKIFGFDDAHFGGHAEFKLVGQKDAFAPIPPSLSFEEAAALTEGSHYALGNIRASGVKRGDEVMVYGATGAIGSAAVQLLTYFGIKVTAVCPGRHIELVRQMGAEDIIDYQSQDYKLCQKKFRFIFDAVGKINFGQCKHLLSDDGIYISTELGPNGENVWKAIYGSFFKGKRILFPIPKTTKEDIEFLGKLALEGHWKPLIDKIYPLKEIVEAHRYVDSGQKIGNVIIKMP